MDISNIIINYANANKIFSTNELFEMLIGETKISKKMLSWHLRKLIDKQKLFRIGRGLYSIETKSIFSPTPNASAIRLYKKLKTEFPLLDFCVYNGEILSDIQHHLSYNNNIYIETERDATETVFHHIQDLHERTYLSPKEDMMSDYIGLDKKAFIIKPLVSEAPTQEIKGIRIPTIEKLLVDIQCDKDFFYLQGQEAFYMMQHAFDNYNVNTNLLLRYASRRNIKSKIEEEIKEMV